MTVRKKERCETHPRLFGSEKVTSTIVGVAEYLDKTGAVDVLTMCQECNRFLRQDDESLEMHKRLNDRLGDEVTDRDRLSAARFWLLGAMWREPPRDRMTKLLELHERLMAWDKDGMWDGDTVIPEARSSFERDLSDSGLSVSRPKGSTPNPETESPA